jgi:K+-sensing histidine kinase KdpD
VQRWSLNYYPAQDSPPPKDVAVKKDYVGPAFDLLRLPTREAEMQDSRLCMLAHDLNNKLNVIVANCDLLLTNKKSFDIQTEQRVSQIKLVAIYMAELIRKRQCPMERGAEAKSAGA